ncbi:unnamed protein product [Prorocentrum cordatum]|uniref:Uncharacterized protein n=1 Tax=Prorocentrum cordatum TaxID=2364126 RepID=A0ABN9PM60_9DINO|nr:unnamed protein product [Polarella glacialis]|mmetsp:Transcript_90574/g.235937  ORF Transcript_90574/g.235937 Transcript_90574/m.235937 type:complete len:131 (+) Transcript_90574:128-520(+)
MSSRASLVALSFALLVGVRGAAASDQLPKGVVELAARQAEGVKQEWPCIWPLCKRGAAEEKKAPTDFVPKTAAEAHRRFDEEQAAKERAAKEQAEAEQAAQEAAAKEAEDSFYQEQEALEIAAYIPSAQK